MRVDHSTGAKPSSKKDPPFLHVKLGMTVVVSEGEDWWMVDLIYMEGRSRDPKVPTLFQIACVNTWVSRWVNAYVMPHVVPAT